MSGSDANIESTVQVDPTLFRPHADFLLRRAATRPTIAYRQLVDGALQPFCLAQPVHETEAMPFIGRG